MVPGINYLENTGPITQKATEVMQATMPQAVTITRTPTRRAPSAAITVGSLGKKWLGKVFDASYPFRAVRNILSGSEAHG
jgi:hypothetical protein